MPPQLLSLAIWAIQQAIVHEPEIAAEIKALLTKADPTPDDWAALHGKIAAKSYADYVQGSALATPVKVTVTTSTPTPPPPPVPNAQPSAAVPPSPSSNPVIF